MVSNPDSFHVIASFPNPARTCGLLLPPLATTSPVCINSQPATSFSTTGKRRHHNQHAIKSVEEVNLEREKKSSPLIDTFTSYTKPTTMQSDEQLTTSATHIYHIDDGYVELIHTISSQTSMRPLPKILEPVLASKVG